MAWFNNASYHTITLCLQANIPVDLFSKVKDLNQPYLSCRTLSRYKNRFSSLSILKVLEDVVLDILMKCTRGYRHRVV